MGNFDPRAIEAALHANTARVAQARPNQAAANAAAKADQRKRQSLREALPAIIETAGRVGALAVAQGVKPFNHVVHQEYKRKGLSGRQEVVTPILAGWTLTSRVVDSLPHTHKIGVSNNDAPSTQTRDYFGPEHYIRSLILGVDRLLYLVDSPNNYLSLSANMPPGASAPRHYGTRLHAHILGIARDHSTLGQNNNPHHVTANTPDKYLEGFDASDIQASLEDLIRVGNIRR